MMKAQKHFFAVWKAFEQCKMCWIFVSGLTSSSRSTECRRERI